MTDKYEKAYKDIAELINTQNVIVGKTKEAINEVLSLIVSDIEEFYSKEPVKYIEYVIKRLKQKDELNIWGRGNPILNANKSIFEYLEAMKDKYEENNSLSYFWGNTLNIEEKTTGKNDTTINEVSKAITKRKRGRPKTDIKSKMIDDADGAKLQRLHEVIQNKEGKDAALVILAAINLGWMTKPTLTQVKEEFGDIGSQQNFTKYLNEKMFKVEEVNGMKNCLRSK